MPKYTKKISETSLRIGEVRFSYVFVFNPRKKEDGTAGKYSAQIIIPKSDTATVAAIQDAFAAAKLAGVSSKWGGKMPPASKIAPALRDGDEEFPGDPVYENCWFFNASSPTKPGAAVLDEGKLIDALDEEDVYSGCYGCAVVNFYPYSSNGNVGVAAGLNNVLKTRDGERLGGTVHTAAQDFGDLEL